MTFIKNSYIHDRSKHINISYHYVRDLVRHNRIKIDYIPTDKMITDGLTESFTESLFDNHKSLFELTRPQDTVTSWFGLRESVENTCRSEDCVTVIWLYVYSQISYPIRLFLIGYDIEFPVFLIQKILYNLRINRICTYWTDVQWFHSV